MPQFSGSTAVWAGSPVAWGAVGQPAPECDEPGSWGGGAAPEWGGDPVGWVNDLYGDHAQRMLEYLPSYYHCTPEVRAMMQAEGYEIDAVSSWATTLATVTLPESCPEWSLPMWEQMLGLGGRA